MCFGVADRLLSILIRSSPLLYNHVMLKFMGKSRTTYGEWAVRVHKMGDVLNQLGISPGGRVGTFAWNT